MPSEISEVAGAVTIGVEATPSNDQFPGPPHGILYQFRRREDVRCRGGGRDDRTPVTITGTAVSMYSSWKAWRDGLWTRRT